ncbi:ParB/RepB/Spo0J family partition protein [Microvirga sp. VF16]|uniref:ParB/RepB/Spo0J family partition protein n=1 Tax=Microvirga sp. VF16 TaxID=2807101 RepID=UPI00193D8F8A|nr:ParB/RepB/Spo0J family partition protein [Microvirga sp. VF16]QRM32945.1 ParB/RepB/Spo0J family partition protein [Microvirga sp. VF16]
MTIGTIALSKLIPSEANVRRFKSVAGIEALAADIAAHGLIQSLNVKPAAKGKFEVLAGGRRLRALKHLQSEGGSILGQKVTKDFPVSVLQGLAEGVTETEISLAENFQRSAMHPAEEIAAFGKLNKEESLSAEEIAARFGISRMTVRRRLALADLSPRILEELRQDSMSLEQAQALTLTSDHDRQEGHGLERSTRGTGSRSISSGVCPRSGCTQPTSSRTLFARSIWLPEEPTRATCLPPESRSI